MKKQIIAFTLLALASPGLLGMGKRPEHEHHSLVQMRKSQAQLKWHMERIHEEQDKKTRQKMLDQHRRMIFDHMVLADRMMLEGSEKHLPLTDEDTILWGQTDDKLRRMATLHLGLNEYYLELLHQARLKDDPKEKEKLDKIEEWVDTLDEELMKINLENDIAQKEDAWRQHLATMVSAIKAIRAIRGGLAVDPDGKVHWWRVELLTQVMLELVDLNKAGSPSMYEP